MPSAKDCAERLREQAYKTLLPQIQDLGEELKAVSYSFSDGVRQVERKLEGLRQIELPTTEFLRRSLVKSSGRRNWRRASWLVLRATYAKSRLRRKFLHSFWMKRRNIPRV